MKVFLVALCIGLGATLMAQKLDETAQLHATPRGEAIAMLDKGEYVYSYEPDDAGWYKIRKEVFLKLNEMAGMEVPAGTALRNSDEETIGKTMATVKLKELDTLKGFRSDDRVKGILEAYIFKTKIADNSIPEEIVTDILKTRNRNEQQERFEALWDQFDAEERDFEDLTAYVIREENKTIDEEKDFRLIVIFRGGTSTYAVITNGHSVEAEKIKDEWQEGDYRVIYFYKPSGSQKELVEKIMYTFMAL